MTTETSSKPEQGAQAARATCCCGPMRCGSESARDILDRRFASGELTKEQYEEMRRQLERSA
jgi:hypothetical protein